MKNLEEVGWAPAILKRCSARRWGPKLSVRSRPEAKSASAFHPALVRLSSALKVRLPSALFDHVRLTWSRLPGCSLSTPGSIVNFVLLILNEPHEIETYLMNMLIVTSVVPSLIFVRVFKFDGCLCPQPMFRSTL